MIKQGKCVYDDVIYVSRTSQSTCAAQLIMLIETETVFLSYRLSITTEKFGYSLSRKTYLDRNTRWNTRNMTASTIDGLKKEKKVKRKTNKHEPSQHLRGNVNNIKQPIHVINLLTQLLSQLMKSNRVSS